MFSYDSIIHANVQIGDFPIDLDIILAEISDGCTLGTDFLKKSGLLKEIKSMLTINLIQIQTRKWL